jgi:predicted CoA-binding protein
MTATIDERVQAAIKEKVWAVVGASNDRNKYGNIIYRDLRGAGFNVYPVNPNLEEVEGDKAYPRLQDLPERPDVADIVVPASVGHQVAQDAAEAGVPYFWLQPGAESPELIAYAESLGLTVIHDACVMVARRTYL